MGLAFNLSAVSQKGLGYFKSTIDLLPVFQISSLYYPLGTSFMSNTLLSKLCCGSFYLVKITLGCKCHVMSLIDLRKRQAGSKEGNTEERKPGRGVNEQPEFSPRGDLQETVQNMFQSCPQRS